MKRAVITGVGARTPLGRDAAALVDGIARGQSAVRFMPDWREYKSMRCMVGAPAELTDADVKKIPRTNRRSMGRMSILATHAALEALGDAGIAEEAYASGRLGCIIGSTTGGGESLNNAYESLLPSKDLALLTTGKFFQCVSHTATMNVSQYLGINGYIMAPAAACASSLHALGIAYDLIRTGRQDMVLCGGAEELHASVNATFDVLYATSSAYNDTPRATPRPFDKDRDGLVCGEGSGLVVLEEYEHARARGAKMYAEVIGFYTCGSGAHISQSDQTSMAVCMRGALADAHLAPDQIDYVSAHATATIQGDEAEAATIRDVFGDSVPVSSLKGNLGHTLGASGGIELIVVLSMIARSKIWPTLNLESVDDACGGVYHVTRTIEKKVSTVLKNSFAFGGINASLVCRAL